MKIGDVAREAGVSIATVSRALNNHSTVNPELVQRVRAAADRLGYRPNGIARNLRRQSTDVIVFNRVKSSEIDVFQFNQVEMPGIKYMKS